MINLLAYAFSFITALFGPLNVFAQTTPATLTLNPASGSVDASTSQTVNLVLNTGSHAITAVQVVATVTGDAAASSITITPQTVSGLTRSYSSVTDVTGGKQFVYIYSIPSADQPFTSGDVNLVQIQYTSGASGSQVIAFDLDNTMIESSDGSGGTLNVLQAPINATYTIATVAPTDVPPTETVTPSPTDVPPTPTSSPITGNLDIDFRLEGITHDAVAQPITFTLKDGVSDSTLDTITQTLTPVTGQNGLYQTTLNNVPGGTIKVCIKGLSHLQRCTVAADDDNQPSGKVHHPVLATQDQTVSLDMATNDLNHLIIGDVDNDNKITLSDSTSILIMYNAFSRDVSGMTTHPPQDVNYDNRITIDDVALNSMNFSDFVVCGDDAVDAACTQ